MSKPTETESRVPRAGTDEEAAAGPPPRIRLSPVQVLASCAAAVTAAVISSTLGVAGTIIGAALASVVATVGTAVYAHSVHLTRARLAVLAAREARPGAPGPALRRSIPWKALAVGSLVVFGLTGAVLTGVELLAGQRVSALVRGGEPSSGRTTIQEVLDPGSKRAAPGSADSDQPGPGPSGEAPSTGETSPPATDLPASPSPLEPSPTPSSPRTSDSPAPSPTRSSTPSPSPSTGPSTGPSSAPGPTSAGTESPRDRPEGAR